MLQHTVTRKIKGLSESFIELVLRPDKFLGNSRYVETIVNRGDNKYEVVFKWVKWGMVKRYWVKFRVYRDQNTVIYESTPDSDNKMLMAMTIAKDPEEGYINITFHAEMEAGTLANLLGKKDFRVFVEELLDTAIKEYMKSILDVKENTVTCKNCAFYEAVKSYCYALDKKVDNPDDPPCGGSMFKKA